MEFEHLRHFASLCRQSARQMQDAARPGAMPVFQAEAAIQACNLLETAAQLAERIDQTLTDTEASLRGDADRS